MLKENCFLLGTIFKLHGYKGDVTIYNEEDLTLDLKNIEFLFIEKNNSLIPFFISKIRNTKPKNILVKFEDINSEDEAKSILKSPVYIPKKFKPLKNTKSTEDITGYNVCDQNLGDLGEITYIDSQTPQTLIYVTNNEKEFCFPMDKEFVKNINTVKRIIEVLIPKELLNLN